MTIALLCREMKWTIHEYWEQPAWLIDTLLTMMREEAKQANKAAKRR